ncbi:DMP19 family protein [Microbulbifer agarilyticus]|uniref:DMP19 family protein n=1 Tax=Microbulbifer agarilyticus TaxID=260552 RepID=UPI001CD336CA|nr:DMP19 family protein [Microbulbifer agarilyticus]MCA0894960.1 DMP19 family protein [Microbulbifer agarilyticus]
MRVILLVLAVLSRVVVAGEYPDSFEPVSAKYDAAGFDSLSEKEQAIYTIWWLEAEVNNGGFHQYFSNSAGDHAVVALASLKNIGAVKTADLLENAIGVAFGETYPQSQRERQNQLGVDEEVKFSKLEELDSKFYEYPENFYKLLDSYVVQ